MRATLASGLVTTVKMVSMLALTAAFSYSVALIAVRVPWVSGRVTLIMRVPSGPVSDPILVVVQASDSPSITTGVTMPCRSSPS
ncbi:hypothetical protein NGUA11_03091 [Salmonella enterica]|nr:hypothetical protein NGUA11_03091 [Salmonella enterica]